MDLLNAMEVAAKGMRAQGIRMRVISQNLANSETTGSKPGEDPYQRQIVTFKNVLERNKGVNFVTVDKVVKDQSEFKLKHDPQHPAADKNGYVSYPNVNPLIEMMDMREAQRSYEANLGIIDMTRSMLVRTIDLLRS
ncbi:MAG: flagellar basal body rod protein FlgC [Pseudomonadota bacterium]|jgi:flagellar basal-body rod protein FlgC|nr:flagellar basal body rod protein FlgC [Pseudomonadota bacterium]QKK05451.1 MAG: flagellar basal body rod protein FlgC [Pseudomonadota bacterium]